MDQRQWLSIQRTSFTNWVNVQLHHAGVGVRIQDLKTDFSDGVNLVTLVEALTESSIYGAVRQPSNPYQKLQNITVALDTVAKDGVKIVNIDSSDISEGNVKLILALIWLLIQRYQGGMGAGQHRRWMLAWLQAVIPDCKISNFTTDWNDGLALCALLEYCKPGIAGDWPSLDKTDKLNNCKKAMELAGEHFGIPLVLRPEDLASPLLDDKSALLYLSYFTKTGGPGYCATRDRIQDKLKGRQITNFTTDWSDGKALAELVTSFGANLPVPGEPHTERSAIDTLLLALEAGRQLGVEPLLTVAEFEQQGSEHLGIMAQTAGYLALSGRPYLAPNTITINNDYNNGYANNIKSNGKVSLYDEDKSASRPKSASRLEGSTASQANPSFQLVRQSSIRSPPAIHIPDHNPLRVDIFSVGVIMESKMTGTNVEFDPELFKVEAEAPSGRIIRMNGDGHYKAQFTPDEIGRWRVSMFYKNKYMDGCPIDVCDPSQVRVRDLRGGLIGKLQTFLVDCTGAGTGDLGVDITHKGKRVHASVHETSTPRLFKVTYTPYDPGPYEVNVHFNRAEVRDSDFHTTDPEERQRIALFNTHVEKSGDVTKITASCDWEVDYMTGGPFVVHITDSSDILVYGMTDGTVCSNPQLIADCTKVGAGEITAEVTHNGLRFPCKVRGERPSVHRLTFKPRGPGVYKIWINYDGLPVKGSPFVQEIAELGKPVAYGDGLKRGMPGKPQTFTVDPRGHPGIATADVSGPRESVPCHLTQEKDGTLTATYVPQETGPHVIDVRLEGKPVEGNPFKPYIVDPSRVRLAGGLSPHVNEKGIIPLHVNKEKRLPFDASEAGVGELTAEVRGPSGRIPIAIDARNDGRHTVFFTPREEGKHYIDVKWSGFPLVDSPYEGFATWEPTPDLDFPDSRDVGVREVVSLRQIPLQSSRPPEEDKDIIPLTVGQEKELTFDTSKTGPGQLTAAVKGPTKKVPVFIGEEMSGQPTIVFTPQEEGKHLIEVNWNGLPLEASPFIGYASHEPNNNSYLAPPVYPFGRRTPSSQEKDKDIIPLKVQQQKQIPFDATEAGPGRLTATVNGPTHSVPVAVQDKGDNKPTLLFTPIEEGKHQIHVDWNGLPLAESPLLGYATKDVPQLNGFAHLAPAPPLLGTSNRIPDQDKDIIPLKVGQEKRLPVDATKAGAGRLTSLVRGPTRNIPAAIEDKGDGTPLIRFTPEEEGKHYIDVNWNNTPLPHSPLLGFATRELQQPNGYASDAPPVYYVPQHPLKDGYPSAGEKDIIPLKVNQQKALPFDATRAGPGRLTATVRGPKRSIPTSVDDKKDGRPVLRFTPEEEGKHYIEPSWNGHHIPQSPLIGYAAPDDGPHYSGLPPVYLAGYHPKTGKPYDGDNDIIPLKVNHPKHLPFDATEAGPGTMTATVRGPRKQIPVTVDDKKNGKPTLQFTPEEEGKHLIDVNYNGQPIPKSPFVGFATKDPLPFLISPGSSRAPSTKGDPDVSFLSSQSSVPPYDPGLVTRVHVLPTESAVFAPAPSPAKVKVILSGRGLKEAEVGKQATFHVDGTQASPGTPTAHLDRDPHSNNPDHHVPVRVDPVKARPHVFKCTYVPKVPGAYKLHVRWNDQPLRGSPFKVNVRAPSMTAGYRGLIPAVTNGPLRPGDDVLIRIDHPDPSKLTVTCTNPRGEFIPCRFLDNLDGTRSLKVTPQMPGRHRVDIKYNSQHIMGSPYNIDISEALVVGTVRVWGPGLDERGGVINSFESSFWVDATGAGAGELKVRIVGPKGAFHVKMRKASQKDKLYQCFYDPVEAGIYTVHVQWSGKHVGGSPFTVHLAHSHQDLEMMRSHSGQNGPGIPLSEPIYAPPSNSSFGHIGGLDDSPRSRGSRRNGDFLY